MMRMAAQQVDLAEVGLRVVGVVEPWRRIARDRVGIPVDAVRCGPADIARSLEGQVDVAPDVGVRKRLV
jgi:hypothetical protein